MIKHNNPWLYIAGAYRAETEWELHQNIENAREAAIEGWKRGYSVFCPHLNSGHMGGVVDDSEFLAAGLDMVTKCQAMFMLPDWQDSEGAVRERKVAKTLDLPIYYSLDELPNLRGK